MKKIIILLSLLATTSCTGVTVGKFSDEKLKTTNGNSWGAPVLRPVTWGFNGINRDCSGECKP